MPLRLDLMPHPDTPSGLVGALEVEVERVPGALALLYALRGDVASLRAPRPAQPRRRDGLWQRTCFEIFLRTEAAEAYCEFNLSPSSEWAAYRFSGYRDGMTVLEIDDPGIVVRTGPDRLELQAGLLLGDVALLDPARSWQASVTAVIVERNGSKSFWALAHPPGAPDFHHRDCFALELPPPGAT